MNGGRGIAVKSSDLVTVGWAYGQPDASLAMAMLRSAGIPVYVQSYYTLSVAWHWTQAFGGMAVQVPASQAAAAAEILADFQGTSSRWRKLHYLFLALIVFFWIGLPPPSNGFCVNGRRPMHSGDSASLSGRSSAAGPS